MINNSGKRGGRAADGSTERSYPPDTEQSCEVDDWGEPERAPHSRNGVPRDLSIYVYYMYVSYVIP